MLVNVGVIGCGYWGPNLIRNFSQLGTSKVTYISDKNEKRLKDIGAMYPHAKLVADYKELLKDENVNAVVIATPINTHFQLAKDALEAGKHVLLEKPMTKTVKEAKELIEIAKKNNLTLMVGHTFEYSPPVNKIKELIEKGEVGKPSYVEIRRHNLGKLQADYNVIWDLAPHDISIVLYALSSSVEKVRALTAKGHLLNNTDSIAHVDVVLKNNVLAHFSSSWISPKKVREMTIIGDKKMIYYDDAAPDEKVKIYDKGVDTKFEVGEVAVSNTIYREGDIHVPYISTLEPLRVECNDFIESIKTGKKPRSDAESGLWVIKALEAMEKSAQIGGAWVSVEE